MTVDPGHAVADAATAKPCCSAFYEQDWVRALAEDCFHPGGAELTRRTVTAMQLPQNAALLDIGCGTGTTALLVRREFGYRPVGIDTSAANIERASGRADSAGVSFKLADAHTLPFDDRTFDGVLAECVFSLLADRRAALTELHRVLKPGGRIGLTDMAVGGTLPDDLAKVAAPWTCISDAVDEDGYRAMFTDAGYKITAVVDESGGLTTMVRNIKRKLVFAGASGLPTDGVQIDLAAARYWIDRFMNEIDSGTIRYLRFQLVAY